MGEDKTRENGAERDNDEILVRLEGGFSGGMDLNGRRR